MLEAYRTIDIPVMLETEKTVSIPFNVELIERVEETIQKTAGRTWIRIHKKEQSLVEAFDWFAQEYLPDVDLRKVQPTFTALFFSSVRRELINSFNEYENLMSSTEEFTEPTAESPTQEEHRSE